MAHPPETRQAVRSAYIYDRLSLEAAAERAGVSYNTVRAWKKKAKEDGDDWDRARNAARLASGGLGDMTQQVLEDFAILFSATMDEIKHGEFSGLEKAEALSRLSDAYTKTMKAAGAGDQKFAKLSVALEVLEHLIEYVRSDRPEAAPVLLDILEPFGERLSAVYG